MSFEIKQIEIAVQIKKGSKDITKKLIFESKEKINNIMNSEDTLSDTVIDVINQIIKEK